MGNNNNNKKLFLHMCVEPNTTIFFPHKPSSPVVLFKNELTLVENFMKDITELRLFLIIPFHDSFKPVRKP